VFDCRRIARYSRRIGHYSSRRIIQIPVAVSVRDTFLVHILSCVGEPGL